jgi:hypothetical protein
MLLLGVVLVGQIVLMFFRLLIPGLNWVKRRLVAEEL